ncbi:sensor histidine kinase [Glycomyces xiaoerkulensis]|uniref:sensor histidine kinase n=1 Tax=Glycomyces xiaoerkulensis TaxID=2038139 RepID=UPI000C25BBA5|nr:ATP-binding protein [Glycomyces xiaoerkulensis]
MSRKARQRTSRLPIRMQLMLPIAAALMGMLVLGLFHTVHVWGSYQDSTDAEVVADLADSLSGVLEDHQHEGGPVLEAVLTGRGADMDLEPLRAETDASIAELERDAEAAVERFPGLHNPIDGLMQHIDRLGTARSGLDDLAAGEASFEDDRITEAFGIYQSMASSLVNIAARLPNLVDDSNISAQIDSLASAMQAGRLASRIQFRVTADLAVLAAEGAILVDRLLLSDAAWLSGNFDRQIIDFQAKAEPEVSEVYDTGVSSEEAMLARESLGIYADGDIPEVSPVEFSAAQREVVTALQQTQVKALEILHRDVTALRDSSTRTLLTTFALIIVLALTAIISAAMLARRISLRVDSVREATLTAAYDTLPKTVASVSQAGNADEVDRLLQTAKQQTVIATDSRYSDELDSLAEAFSAAHHQALRQTANQALLRIDVEAMMKTLARRGQSLIRRQQQVMESLVDASGSTDGIPEEWRSVYHLLSRMRRNEENLLLLAGGDPQRRYDRPTDIGSIISDAVGEIEAAGRVLVDNQVSACLETKPAGDVARILAELLDNATAYSPPNQQVRVSSRRSGSEIVVSVADDGIGLNPDQMSAINRRLAEPTQLNSELTATMGLLVVGRLAAEHSVSVQLHSTTGKGTLALVRLPASVQAEMHAGMVGVGPSGSSARLALSAHAANLPMTGTGTDIEAEGANEPIVPKARRAGVTPEPRPVAGPEPTAGANNEPVDVTFRKVNRALESAGGPNGTELPRRAPGTELIPGSVPGAKPGSGEFDLDPAEIRERLTGFASGIAAASEQEQR